MKAVNLLPHDLRGALKTPAPVAAAGEPAGGSGAYVVLGALALCVVALAGYVLSSNAIKQHKADLADLEARNAAVLAESARLKPYADFQSMAQARIATVRDLATQRFDWERSFRDLARAVPQDVTVKTLGASVSSQSGAAGGTSSPLRSAIDAPAIQIDGCTSSQRSVARMMARLRAVQGVTRVTLQSSTKPAASSTVTGAVPGAPVRGCDASGKSSPPDFTVVVFFERDKAAAAAPPAAGDAPAAGSAGTAGTASTPTPPAATAATSSSTTVSTTTDGAK